MSPSQKSNNIILCLSDIRLSFDGNCVLNNINLSLSSGEMCCIMGENGSGKSTLMNVISGIYHPDSGSIYIDGRQVSFLTPADAQNAGIYYVMQEPHLVTSLSVEKNIFMGH